MALTDYTLLQLRTRVADDFGVDVGITAVKNIVDAKINDAIQWIVRRKQNWPWMRKPAVVNVDAAVTETGDFTKAGVTVANVTSPVGVARDILTTDTSGTLPATGWMISAADATSYTLDAQYLAATEATKSFRIVKGIFQLPTDFLRMEKVLIDESLPNPRTLYLTPDRFEKKILTENLVGVRDRVFTVKADPLLTDDRKYLFIYPYYSAVSVIRYFYWFDPQALSADGDIPIIPRVNRMVLLHAAEWMFAVAREDSEKATFYRDMALDGLERMTEHYELTDDPEEDTAAEFEEPDWITPPAGYEDFPR